MRLFFINTFVFFSFFLPKAFGQMTEGAIKSNFIINMAKFVEWENEDTIKRYTIGVLGGEDIFEEFKSRAREILLKDKKFDVVQFKKINEIGNVNILYVDKRSDNAFRKVFEIAMAKKILMFSDSCLNRDIVMINLLDLDMPGSQFEVNKNNMAKANVFVSPKLIYYGGSEEDLRGLYQASEQQLSNVQGELEQQSAALKNQREELEIKKKEIFTLNDEIASQEEHLKSMTSEVEARQDSLDQKVALLEVQKLKISRQQADIETQNDQLLKQKQEIKTGNAFLNRQKIDIKDQEQKIEKQQLEIQKQTQTLDRQTGKIKTQTLKIEKQQSILYYFIVFFALIATMIFFILRAYRIKRQANKKLEEKNAAISRQKTNK